MHSTMSLPVCLSRHFVLLYWPFRHIWMMCTYSRVYLICIYSNFCPLKKNCQNNIKHVQSGHLTNVQMYSCYAKLLSYHRSNLRMNCLAYFTSRIQNLKLFLLIVHDNGYSMILVHIQREKCLQNSKLMYKKFAPARQQLCEMQIPYLLRSTRQLLLTQFLILS